eukprot:CAMPEP_0169332862 /NCGR_PEP_ID=MMETSP1017-20121227/14950_1 /TAXON_ID=342587 /ORGANISM="Karlodinium micrum, Strain CCMP2283" /LENGTH=207 /DNA_ID=CAMNT_0009428041 /DNA_START=33 /DNA_END=652 /DNA_ORIENTATION=+
MTMKLKDKEGSAWMQIRRTEAAPPKGEPPKASRSESKSNKSEVPAEIKHPDSIVANSGSDKKPGEPGHPLRGLSVHFLTESLPKMLKKRDQNMQATVRQIEPALIRSDITKIKCPRDGRDGAAFVDAIKGRENAGHATHMLSYTWGYKIGNIVESLEAWCKKNDHQFKETMIWICCFCINQYRVIEQKDAGKSVTFEAFKHEFDTRV